MSEPPKADFSTVNIKVLGVGGGGSNAVQHMINCGVPGVEFICANTDAQALSHSSAHHVIQLGRSGLSAAGKPDRGRKAAERARAEIRKAITDAHMLCITAGMGGGTGSGAVPTIARIAKEMGIFTVALVTQPFDWEMGSRMRNAELGLRQLEAIADALIVVPNEKLLEMMGSDVTLDEAFSQTNSVLMSIVRGVADIASGGCPHIGVDYEDVRTALTLPGKAGVGTGMGFGPDRARVAAEQAVVCPLLEDIVLSEARRFLVLISSSKGSLQLNEVQLAMTTIRLVASENAHIIYGTTFDNSLGDAVRVTVIASCLAAC